jgi:hypothetical protein
MGQASGAAAALAVKAKTSPGQLSLADLRRVLRQQGAIVPASEAEKKDAEQNGSGA